MKRVSALVVTAVLAALGGAVVAGWAPAQADPGPTAFGWSCNDRALVGEWNLDGTGWIPAIDGVSFPTEVGGAVPVQAVGKARFEIGSGGQGRVTGFTTDAIGGVVEKDVPMEGTYSMQTETIGGEPVCVGDIKIESLHDPEHGGPHHHCFEVMPARLASEFKFIAYPCPDGYNDLGLESITGTALRDR